MQTLCLSFFSAMNSATAPGTALGIPIPAAARRGRPAAGPLPPPVFTRFHSFSLGPTARLGIVRQRVAGCQHPRADELLPRVVNSPTAWLQHGAVLAQHCRQRREERGARRDAEGASSGARIFESGSW